MRITSLFCMVIMFISISFVFAEDGEISFAGEWILDMDKSEIPESNSGRRGRAATKLIVEQGENRLVVESTSTNRDGEERVQKATYTLDGKVCENEMYNTTSKSTAEWSEDRKSLKINTEATFSRNGEEFKISMKNTWSLDNGDLKIDSFRSTPRGDRESKLVYKKSDAK